MPATNRLLNILLRGSTLAAKFGLLAILALLMPPEDVGYYGLLTAAIGWTTYLVGWEFYTFSMREIIARRSTGIRNLIRDQVVLYGLTYLLVAPLIVLIFATDMLPARYGVWFAVLLVLEHLGLELGRVLLSLSRPLLASLMLFLRGGAWCIAAASLLTLFPDFRHLDVVLAFWTVGSALGLGLGLLTLRRMTLSNISAPVEWAWLRKGMTVALPLMLASLAVRGIFTIDRFGVEMIGGAQVLGAYVVFIGVATAVISFIDAGIVDFAYPRVVRAAQSGDTVDYIREMRQLERSVVASAVVLSVGCWGGLTLFTGWLPNPTYAENLSLLPPIVIAIALYAISTVPHVGLYAHGRDRTIVASQITGLVVFLGAVLLGQAAMGVAIIPLALIAAFATILVWKATCYLKLRREQGRL